MVLMVWIFVTIPLMLDLCLFINIGEFISNNTPWGYMSDYGFKNWMEGLKAYIPGLPCKLIIIESMKGIFKGKPLAINAVPPLFRTDDNGHVTGVINRVTIGMACDNWGFFLRSLRRIEGFYNTGQLIAIGIFSIIVLGFVFRVARGFQRYRIEKSEHRLIKEGLGRAKASDEIIKLTEDISGCIIIYGKTKKGIAVKKIISLGGT